jgi:hypothetical protein
MRCIFALSQAATRTVNVASRLAGIMTRLPISFPHAVVVALAVEESPRKISVSAMESHASLVSRTVTYVGFRHATNPRRS